MGELKNNFTWSYSRHGLFDACRRKYWLNHYGSWGGWDRQLAPERVREIYIQKNLTTVPMWIGTVVHDTAEQCLKSLRRRQLPRRDQVVARALARARRNIRESREGAWRHDPKRRAGFQHDYYQLELRPDPLPGALEEIRRQVETLLDCRIYGRMAQAPQRILEVEDLVQIDVDGTPVWVKLDALMQGREGVVVVDWKTGRFHAEATVDRQLGVYGLYAVQRWQGRPGHIQAMHVNLRADQWRTFTLEAEHLEASRAFITESADRMRALLRDVEHNVAEEEDFPMKPEGDPGCDRCRFRRDCGRG